MPLSLFILTCCSTETKKADTAEPQVQEQKTSKEYKIFADKFYKKDLPLLFPGKIKVYGPGKARFKILKVEVSICFI